MIHYIEDNNKRAKAYIDSEDGELFVSVYVEEIGEQYDFGIDEKELQLIAYMIEHGKEAEKCNKLFSYMKSLPNEPVNEDLEEVAYRYAIKCEPLRHEDGGYTSPNPEVVSAVKYGADWQIEKLMKDAIEREVKIDAGGYPYIDCNIEFYDYDIDVPLAKKGDKVKLIVIQDGQRSGRTEK